MPFVEASSESRLADLLGIGGFVATGTHGQFLKASLSGSGALVVNPSVLIPAQATLGGVGTIEAVGRLNNDPNVFGTAELAGVGTAECVGMTAFAGISVLSGNATLDANGTTAEAERADLIVFYDIFPVIAAGANIQILNARLLIDDVQKPIRSFRLQAPPSVAGLTLSVELSKPLLADVPVGASFTFDIYAGGAWATLVSGDFGGRDYAVSFAGDSLSISTVDSTSEKLGRCPSAQVLFYDPAKQDAPREDAASVLRDDLNNAYPVTLRAIGGLSLYDLLNYALVEICGFTAYQTNIPDFPILRADFGLGRPAIETVNALIGMYEPLIFERNGTAYVLDSTIALPAGFTSLELPASRFQSLNLQAGNDAGTIDGLILNYADSGFADYYTQRYETEQQTSGGGLYGTIDISISREFRDYRNSANPPVVVRTMLKSELKTIKDASGVVIGEESTIYDVNSRGLVTGYTRTVDSRVPMLNGTGAFALRNVSTERQNAHYSTDSTGRTWLSLRETMTSALVATDSDNPFLDEPFEQDFLEAFQAGNLKEGMDVSTKPTKTVSESFQRLANGQTTVTVTTADHLRNGVTESRTNAESGEAVVPNRQTARRLIIWRSGFVPSGGDLSQRRLDSFSVGELPLSYAKPLAMRRLNRIVAGKGTGSATLFGYDASIRRGSTFTVKGRAAESLGSFIVAGYSITGDALGTDNARVMTALNLIEL